MGALKTARDGFGLNKKGKTLSKMRKAAFVKMAKICGNASHIGQANS